MAAWFGFRSFSGWSSFFASGAQAALIGRMRWQCVMLKARPGQAQFREGPSNFPMYAPQFRIPRLCHTAHEQFFPNIRTLEFTLSSLRM